jgi:hypothetical protein
MARNRPPHEIPALPGIVYIRSDIPSSLSKTRRSRQPGSRTMSLMRSPRSHARFSPAKILRRSIWLILAAGLVRIHYRGYILALGGRPRN